MQKRYKVTKTFLTFKKGEALESRIHKDELWVCKTSPVNSIGVWFITRKNTQYKEHGVYHGVRCVPMTTIHSHIKSIKKIHGKEKGTSPC